jgi:acetoacetate decarboxylase
MTLAEIVVDQLVFVLAAHDEVLDTDSAVDLLQSAMTSVADLPEAEFVSVRQVTADRLTAAGAYPPGIEDALRELVLLLDEIEAG